MALLGAPRITSKGATRATRSHRTPFETPTDQALEANKGRPEQRIRDRMILLERSRWRAGAVTFGPVGRIVASIVIVTFFVTLAISSLIGLAFTPIYLGAIVILLREVWSKQEIDNHPNATIVESIREMREPVAIPPAVRPGGTGWGCRRCGTELDNSARWYGICREPVRRADAARRLESPPTAT